MTATELHPVPVRAPASDSLSASTAAVTLEPLRKQRFTGRIQGVLDDPLLRNGHTLTLSAAITGLVGIAYWALAANRYEVATVGRDSAAISAFTLLAGVAQLNLSNALIRFVPTAGPRTRRLVIASYAIILTISAVVAAGFVLLRRSVSPRLEFIGASPTMAALFVASTMLSTIFVVQDSVLTGLRRTGWVAGENGLHSVAKVVMVFAFAGLFPMHGIFYSWSLSILLAVAVTNIALFGWALRGRREPAVEHLPAQAIRRYVAVDYVGAVFWLGATQALPLLVVATVGATATAYFALAWVIAYSLYLLGANMGQSLVVETAGDQASLENHWRHLMAHTTKLMLVAVAVLVAGASLILRPFGADYARNGTTLLRLLALSALPHLVTVTAVSAARSQRRVGLALLVLCPLCTVVVGLSWVLLPRVGITGVGVACLVAQTGTAGVLLLTRRAWLRPRSIPHGPVGARSSRRVRGGVPRLLSRVSDAVQPRWAMQWTQRQRSAFARVSPDLISDALDRPPDIGEPITSRPVCTVTDVAVAVVWDETRPLAVVKVPATLSALSEVRAQHRVLDEMHHDDRLVGQRALLPRSRLVERDAAPFAVETWLPGQNGEQLLRDEPDASPWLVTAALSGLARMRAATTRTMTIGVDQVAAWIDQPLAVIQQRWPESRHNRWRHAACGAVRELVCDDLAGVSLEVGLTHGDFSPGNVLFGDDGRLTGIVDWSRARPDEAVHIDLCTMLLTAWAVVDRRELGTLITEGLHTGSWISDAVRVLGIVPELARLPRAVERPVLLLAWAKHAAANLAKSDRYRSRIWTGCMVDPVLEAVAR